MGFDLRPYPEYKKSGVPWLGEVPEHWEVLRLKATLSRPTKNGLFKKKDAFGSGAPLINVLDVYREDFQIDTASLERVQVTDDELKVFEVKSGDLFFVRSSLKLEGTGRSAVLIDCKSGAVFECHLVQARPRPERVSPRLLVTQLNSFGWRHYLISRANVVTMATVGQDVLATCPVLLPPPSEQDAIVQFLAHLYGRTEQYLRRKRKLIAVLREQRQAIVNQAVTRGIDPNARLKPSGIPWLGDIPAHWRFERGKFLFREVDVRSATGEEELLSVSHITGVTPRSQKNITMFKAESYVDSKLCSPGQIAINTMWAWMAAVGVSRYYGIVSPSYHTYEQITPDTFSDGFLDLLLRTTPYKTLYTVNSSGITSSRLRLYPEDFLNIRFLCPPRDEQEAILGWLQNATSDCDKAISRAEREIELINEYRNRLISDVVTGKLDVRNAVAQIPSDGTCAEPFDEPDLDPNPEYDPEDDLNTTLEETEA